MSDANYPKDAVGKPRALEVRGTEPDGRRYSPSAARNRDVIASTFKQFMRVDGIVLEIASGSGEHGVHLCEFMPTLSWWYSDIDPDSYDSQNAWKQARADLSLNGPLSLDVAKTDWVKAAPTDVTDLFCANMIHIAPFEAAEGLIRGAGDLLASGGRLYLYGPFSRNGEMVESNRKFDLSLKSRDPSWGVRDLDQDILPLAVEVGLELETVVEMPANNLSVFLRKI